MGGSTSPSNPYTLKTYSAECTAGGHASGSAEAKTINGQRQIFLHQEATQVPHFASLNDNTAAGVFNGSSASLSLRIQSPITFQLIGGESLTVVIQYTTKFLPGFLFYGIPNGIHAKTNLPLVKVGTNKWSVPVGGDGGIPRGAKLTSLSFTTDDAPDGTCKTYTTDINDLQVGGQKIGISTETKSCGSGCPD